MLKKIYAHNYKCFVNFEINFDKNINLILGGNGSGKTSLFNVLIELRKFVVDNEMLNDDKSHVFRPTTLTRWLDASNIQKFELEVLGNGGTYSYELEIEHFSDKTKARVKIENLFFDGQPLYKFSIETDDGFPIGNGRLFNDNNTNKDGVPYSIDWFRSGLGTITERRDNKKLIWFKNWLSQLYIVRINPEIINADFSKGVAYPNYDLSNFPAWLFSFNNENREGMRKLEDNACAFIKGFSSFKFSPYGERQILEIKEQGKIPPYNFKELSDGQKSLIILYALIFCLPQHATICIDEPENFLALREIQPWLNQLEDQSQESNLQALLISHHPSLINLLAADTGQFFSIEENHVRTQRIGRTEEEGLPLSALIESGWIYGD